MTLRIVNFDDEPFGEFNPELADAVRFGDRDRVFELLSAGIDPNAVDSQGEHVLLTALRNEHAEVATILINGGARPDSYTSSGASPLWLACTLGFENVVKVLLDSGAPINDASQDHSTPLSVALQAGHWSLAEFLRQKGGVVLEQDEYHAEMDRSYAKPGFDFATADTAEFKRAVSEFRSTFDLEIGPASDRAGIYACSGEVLNRLAAQLYDDTPRNSELVKNDNLISIVRRMGYSLIYNRLDEDGRPMDWLLLPTDDKYPVVREVGPYSDHSMSENQGLIWILVDIEEDNPFDLIGCGLTFVQGVFRNEFSDPDDLAEHLMQISPTTTDCFDSIEAFSKHLVTTRTFRIS